MKKLTRRISALALALGLGLTLAACGGSGLSKFDAVAYVDGLLKETYLGEFDKGFMELVGITEAEAQDTYENCLEVETQHFMSEYMYAIEYPTDELIQEIQDMYAEIYSHAKFEVVSAAEQDDGSFSVKVNVEPIDIYQLAEADWETTMAPFFEKYPPEVQDNMTDAEYEAMDQEWARMIVDLYKEKLPETGNLPVQSIVVQLEKDEDGYYSITDQDFSNLDALIIDYSMPSTDA